ncbi:MAG: long-chain-fatty-acid--CoA ligase [Nocardioidaceae bacterium]
MDANDQRPWASSYAPGVPLEIPVPEDSLVDLFESSTSRFGPLVALDFFGAPTTYKQLREQVSKAAEGLRRLGVQPGDRVALVLPNCPQHVVAFYAVLRLGAIVVEHNPLYTREEMSFQLEDHHPRAIIAWDRVAPMVKGIAEEIGTETVLAVDLSAALPLKKRFALRLPLPKARRARVEMTRPAPGAPGWEQLVANSPALRVDHARPHSWDVALLQYTGGTTGRPKAAMLTHRNLLANAAQGRAWMPGLVDGQEVIYAVLPLFHAYGLTLCLTFAVSIGATLVLLPRFDVDMVLDAMRRRPATFLPGVPPIYERLAKAARERGVDLTSIRYAISGAMPLPRSTADLWESVTGGILVEGYGMTETSPVALGNPAGPSRRIGAVGVPFPSTEVRVVDREDHTRVLAHGEPGELLLRGPQVFGGYWERPEETAKVLVEDGWLRTGDVVVMDEDGFFTIVDRIKELIITGGFNVYPSEVEEALRHVPAIADAAVVGLPAHDGGEEVVAAVVLDEGASFDEGAIRTACKQRLAAYKVPRRVFVVDNLPLSMIGKVLRRQVRDQLLARTSGGDGVSEPMKPAHVVLSDGSHVLIRQVHLEDAPLLDEAFARFSLESRRLRFLTDKARLNEAEMRYFTQVDHHDHEAIGAVDEAGGLALGIARYIRDTENPEVAEIAVAVVDSWQGLGLGTALVTRLMDRARKAGIQRVTALVAVDNEVMVNLLHDLGGELHATPNGAGAVDYELTPAPEGPGEEVVDLLRAFGHRQLRAPTSLREALAALVPPRFHS